MSDARAAAIAWDGGSATDWGNPTNWAGDVVPASTDSAAFVNASNIAYQQVIDTAADRTLTGISIGTGSTTNGFVNNFTIANNTLTLTGGTRFLNASNVDSGTNAATVFNVRSQTLTGGTTGQVGNYTVSSNVTLAVPGTGQPPTVNNLSGNATVNFTGVLATSTAGTVRSGFRVEGGGSVALTNPANTYAGPTVVANGTLFLRASDAANGTSGVLGSGTNAVALGHANDTAAANNIALYATDGATIARNINVISTAANGAGGTGTVSIGGATNGASAGTYSGTITLNRSLIVRSNGTGNNVVNFTGQITGTGDVTKTQSGVVRWSNPANNYAGTTTLTAGTLRLGASEVIPNLSAVTFNGGTLETAGFSETAGALTLAANSAINFGSAGTVSFADSSAATWGLGATLQLLGWNGSATGAPSGSTHFLIGGGATLSVDQLAAIDFINPAGFDPGTYDAAQLSTGEIVPVPEPASVVVATCAAAALVLGRRRRVSA